MNDRLFARLSGLFDVAAFEEARVMIAGCGSGGGQVALQLVMSGVKNLALVDHDELEIENVIRHVCGLRHVGMQKTKALDEVLRDRNPDIVTQLFEEDILNWPGLEAAVSDCELVILATDNDPTRYLINEICIRRRKPFVVAKVFTRGIGGEVFHYRPGDGGCLACLERVLERTQFREGVREIDLVSDEERAQLYGLEPKEIKDSPGLSVDIGFITSFHTRFALEALAAAARERPKFLTPIEENYLVWGNRALHPFKKNFELQRINLRRQSECLVCGGGDDV